MKRSILVYVIVLLVAIVVASCTPVAPSTTTPTTPTTSTKTPIKLACAIPLTGSYSMMAVDQKAGLQIAVDEINAAGGVNGRPLEVILRDDELKADVSLRRCQEMVDSGAVAILGTLSGAIQQSVNSWCKERDLAFFCFTGATPPINDKNNVGPGTFAMYDLGQGIYSTVDMIVKQEPTWKKVYLVIPDYALGYAERDLMPDRFKKYGVEVVGMSLFPINTTDYGPLVNKALASGADATFIGIGTGQQIGFVKAWQDFGGKGKQGLFTNFLDLSMLNGEGAQAAEGMYYCGPYMWTLDTPAFKKWATAYNAKYPGDPPPAYAFYAYSMTKLAAKGLAGAKSFSGTDIGKYILANPDMELATGQSKIIDYLRTFAPPHFLVRGKHPNDIKGKYDLVDIISILPGSVDVMRSSSLLGY